MNPKERPSILSDRAELNSGVISLLRQAVFLISLPFGILDFVLPIYGRSVGAGPVEIGLFFSAFSLMIVVLRPVVGTALDRWGRRPFFLAGLSGYGLTMLAFALSDDVYGLVLARIIQGIASACLWLSAQTITADVAGTGDRGRAFGRITESSSQGAILGTIIGFGVLFSMGVAEGWLPLFLGYSAVGFGAVLLTRARLAETRQGGHGLAGHSATKPIIWTRPWILLLTTAAVTGASWAMLAPVMMIFLQDHFTVEVERLAQAFLPAALVWALLPARLGGLADRFGRKPLMVLGMLAAAITALLIPTLTSLMGLSALWAFQALCTAAGDPAEQALVADLTGDEARGRAYGLYMMAAGLGATISPLVGGWLYDSMSPAAPFIANGIMLLLTATVLIFFLQEPNRKLDLGGR